MAAQHSPDDAGPERGTQSGPHMQQLDRIRLGDAVLRLEEAVAHMPAPSLAAVARILVREARQLLPSLEAVLSVVYPWDRDTLTVLAGAGPWAASLVGGSWPVSGTLTARVLTSGGAVETADAPGEDSGARMFSSGPIRIGRLVPVLGEERLQDSAVPLGVLSFWRGEGEILDEERCLIDLFARHASLHLVATEAGVVARRVQRQLEVSHTVALELQESLAPKDVIGRLISIAAEVSRADRATLSSIREGVITVEATTGAGSAPEWIGRSYGSEFLSVYPEVQEALDTGRPVVGGRLNVDAAATEFREALASVKRTLTLPLVAGDSPIGFLLLSRFEDRPFEPDERDLMDMIVSVATLALRNAWGYARVEEANRLKSDFLNAAAHELRTPITVVQGYLDLMLNGQLGDPPAPWLKPLTLLQGSGTQLSRLIDSILDAARLDAGTVTVPLQHVDVRDVVANALGRAEARIALTGALVSARIPDTPVMATTNPDFLGRVLDNLIDNALTYHGGSPDIEVVLEAGPEPELLVRDHGFGIPAEDRQRIFDRFTRVTEGPWNQFRGTGLGLHLSRQFAVAAGAQLSLRDTSVGKGTTFAVTLK